MSLLSKCIKLLSWGTVFLGTLCVYVTAVRYGLIMFSLKPSTGSYPFLLEPISYSNNLLY
jgi:hypothetical protein